MAKANATAINLIIAFSNYPFEEKDAQPLTRLGTPQRACSTFAPGGKTSTPMMSDISW